MRSLTRVKKSPGSRLPPPPKAPDSVGADVKFWRETTIKCSIQTLCIHAVWGFLIFLKSVFDPYNKIRLNGGRDISPHFDMEKLSILDTQMA